MSTPGVTAPAGDVLRTLPVEVIEISAVCVIVKRGRTEVKISGERASEAVRRVLAVASLGLTRDEICNGFPAPDRSAVAELISKFQEKRILVSVSEGSSPVPTPESTSEIFYWHFGASATNVTQRLKKMPVTIIGVNNISRRLATALAADGAPPTEILHYPLLCNLRLLDDRGELRPEEWPSEAPFPRDYKEWWDGCDPQSMGCVVATSDFGGLNLMRSWNEFCVRNKLHFLPVVLQDLIGYIGPLVVPGETACFECSRARQNSHLPDPEVHRAAEQHSFETQRVAGFHPSMASVLGDLAALELSRFYGGWAPPRIVGTLIEVNLVGPEMTMHRVLKVPRCQVCATQNRHTRATPLRNMFLPGNEWPK